MKILIATGIFPPDIGGPATYSKLLFDELPKRGFEVDILSFGEVRKFPKLIRHFLYFLKVLKLGRKADIIFAQDPVSVGLPVCIASKILRKKFALKIVGDYAWEQGMQRFGVKDLLDDFLDRKYGWQVEILRKIQKFVAKNASIIIVPSGYLEKIVSSWGIDSGKIRVIYNSFESRDLILSKDEARKKLDLNGFILVSAGRMVPWKGFDVLIDIMPEILKEILAAKLIIIGDGPEKENLKFKIKNLKLENKILLAGQLSQGNVLSYLRAGDLFVLNTGYEGFSHQILEAMSVGIPVITTNIGGNPEIVENEKTGILVKYNEKAELESAILKLYENTNLKNEIVQNAKVKAVEFSKERMLKATIKVLSSL